MIPGFLGRGRTDALTPDVVGGVLEIPSLLATFAELKAFFERRGFNVRELVVSSIGGQAVERFSHRGVQFTPNPERASNR